MLILSSMKSNYALRVSVLNSEQNDIGIYDISIYGIGI